MWHMYQRWRVTQPPPPCSWRCELWWWWVLVVFPRIFSPPDIAKVVFLVLLYNFSYDLRFGMFFLICIGLPSNTRVDDHIDIDLRLSCDPSTMVITRMTVRISTSDLPPPCDTFIYVLPLPFGHPRRWHGGGLVGHIFRFVRFLDAMALPTKSQAFYPMLAKHVEDKEGSQLRFLFWKKIWSS